MLVPAFLSHLTGKDVLKYTFTPAIGPRLKELLEGGFSNLALFMVLIYQAVRLLPASHPYSKPENFGQYSIREVLSEASKNLIFNLKHIDQIIIFFALIVGIIILCIQFVLLLTAAFIQPAKAAMPEGIGEFFTNSAPTKDIAYRMLDSVFGVPDLFGSQEPTETAFHTALHGLFQFYSVGLLVIGAILLIYFIFVVFAETAQTGTPFGKRFNHAWVPIRLVVAFGLLIPISYGLNSGQWITLYSAKLGSNFATNGWNKFYETLQEGSTLGDDSPIAQTNIPELHDLAAFMTIAKACKFAYEKYHSTYDDPKSIEAWVISSEETRAPKAFLGTYESDAQFSNYKMINIRFGEKDPSKYQEEAGGVQPFCGDISLAVPDPIQDSGPHESTLSAPNVINKAYYRLIYTMWRDDFAGIEPATESFIDGYMSNADAASLPEDLKSNIFKAQIDEIKPKIEEAMQQAREEFGIGTEYLEYGWGGAGIFYNDIAAINGRLANAIMNEPAIRKYPLPMELTCDKKVQTDENVSPEKCYDPNKSKDESIDYADERTGQTALALSRVHAYWYDNPGSETGNALVDVINLLFGTQGLFDMCRNADTHPLGQLSALGKGLIETAIRNIGAGLGLAIGSVIPVVGPTAGAISKMAFSFASIGILIGFILYYLVPFLPFLYFLFAVGGWIKGIFEAMVGVPLWALAHIRIDGQGLPGDGAINGYYLIFEIFIRPILIVFGLIAAVLTFGAMIKVLNEVFGIAVDNLSGNNTALEDACFSQPDEEADDVEGVGGIEGEESESISSPDEEADDVEGAEGEESQSISDTFRGPIDEFFYTVVYAILVYMIGMASFKLIDLIPNNILRWMGQGLQTFNDQAGEPAEGLLQKVAIGGGLIGGQLQQAGAGLGQGASGLVAGAKDVVAPPKQPGN
jgi:conjugal transfer/type IV secretion protein DotA/TraY